jgi:hypothetical protein
MIQILLINKYFRITYYTGYVAGGRREVCNTKKKANVVLPEDSMSN